MTFAIDWQAWVLETVALLKSIYVVPDLSLWLMWQFAEYVAVAGMLWRYAVVAFGGGDIGGD